MGFSYRKSFKAGPLRMTMSKSGVSYSVGAKGARVTRRANGRVQTTLSVPGTGLKYTSSTGGTRVPQQSPAKPTQTRPMTHEVAANPSAKQRTPGTWYFWTVLLSCGLLAAVPFAHASARLKRQDLRMRAIVYGGLGLALGILSSVVPHDAQGNAVGTVGSVLAGVVGVLAIAVMVTACLQLAPVRRAVFGLGQPPLAPSAAGPSQSQGTVIDAHLAARARREEARALSLRDPVLAQDLGIGRPELPRQYDDGGLVDLNHASADTIAQAIGVDAAVAERIVAARQELGAFSAVDEVLVYVNIEGVSAARVRDYSVLLPA